MGLITVPTLWGTTYTYTKIADNAPGTPFAFATFPGPFLINSEGVVAFSVEGPTINAIYTGTGAGINKVVQEDSVRFILSGLNDSGRVAYLRGAMVNTATAGGTPFLVGQSGGATLYPVINNAGTVAFQGQNTIMIRTGSGPVQTFVSDTELPRAIVLAAPLLVGASINNSGTVAFYATNVTSATGCNCGIFTKGQGSATLIVSSSTASAPQINDNGAVAFAGVYQGKHGVFVANSGQVGAVVDLTEQAVTLNENITLNNAGKVAYVAKFGVSPSVQGVFTGPDKVADRVIASGDPLFGSVVQSIDPLISAGRFMNDKGQVAFSYVLSNGLRGVAVATPVDTGTPPPTLNAGGIVNAASFAADAPAAPGSIVSLFGTNFITELAVPPGDPLPTSLNGVRVTFNGIPAPLFFVAPGQINAQVPYGVTGPTASVQVTNAAGQSETRTVNIAPQSPAIFTANQNGVGQGVIVFGNTATIVGPVRPGVDWRPARVGDTITIYANGLGAVTPPINDGWNSCDQSICAADLSNLTLRTTSVRPQIKIGGVTVPDNMILFSGLTPQFAGLYQINVTIPNGVQPSNQVPVVIQMGNNVSPPNVSIAMQ